MYFIVYMLLAFWLHVSYASTTSEDSSLFTGFDSNDVIDYSLPTDPLQQDYTDSNLLS